MPAAAICGPRRSAEPAAGATLDGVVESGHAVAETGGRLLGQRLRLPREGGAHLGAREDVRERELERGAAHESLGEFDRQLALQRVGQGPLEGRAGQDLRDDPLGPLALARRHDLRFEFGARQRLDHHSLDDAMLDERPGDCLRQCAGEDAVDDLLGLGRREHLLGHPLESAARIDAGAAAGLGQTLRLTSERRSDR